jgi:DNA-binding transcriptional ArsR family regulator
MGLEDKIEEEMYVDTESLLEEEFDRAKGLYNIYGDNTVAVTDPHDAIHSKEQILIHLIAWQYISETDEDETPALTNEYFYDRIDKGDSTIRGYFSDLVDAGIVRKTDEEGQNELMLEHLSEAIDRIEDAVEEG